MVCFIILKVVRSYNIDNAVYTAHLSPVLSSHVLVAGCLAALLLLKIAVASQDSQIRLCDLRSPAAAHTLSGFNLPGLLLFF